MITIKSDSFIFYYIIHISWWFSSRCLHLLSPSAFLVVFISPLTPPPYFPFIGRFNRPFREEDSPVISLSGCHSSLSLSLWFDFSHMLYLPMSSLTMSPMLCPSPSRPLNSSQFTSHRTLTTFHLPFSFTFYSGSHFLSRVFPCSNQFSIGQSLSSTVLRCTRVQDPRRILITLLVEEGYVQIEEWAQLYSSL